MKSRMRGLAEHDWNENIRKEWIKSLRGKAAGQLRQQAFSPEPSKTAAAF